MYKELEIKVLELAKEKGYLTTDHSHINCGTILRLARLLNRTVGNFDELRTPAVLGGLINTVIVQANLHNLDLLECAVKAHKTEVDRYNNRMIKKLDASFEKTEKVDGVENEHVSDLPFTPNEIYKLLSQSNGSTREEWITIGMLIHNYYKGSEKGLDIWNDWSSHFSGYVDKEDCRKMYSTFNPPKARMEESLQNIKEGNTFEKELVEEPSEDIMDMLKPERRKETLLNFTSTHNEVFDKQPLTSSVKPTDLPQVNLEEILESLEHISHHNVGLKMWRVHGGSNEVRDKWVEWIMSDGVYEETDITVLVGEAVLAIKKWDTFSELTMFEGVITSSTNFILRRTV